MTVYLIRHGRDDDTVRGGWSNSPLTEKGVEQTSALAERLKNDPCVNVGAIYASDLPRAVQTAQIIASALVLPIELRPMFRETNNGVLAGMKNELANEKYPGLFWNTLGWDEQYPQGESPHEFFNRIFTAWKAFRQEIAAQEKDVILVTHGGVINVILHIERGLRYSNKEKGFYTPNAGLVALKLY